MSKTPAEINQSFVLWQQRNQAIWRERQSGKTYTAIARMFSICPERVRQIVKRQERKELRVKRRKVEVEATMMKGRNDE